MREFYATARNQTKCAADAAAGALKCCCNEEECENVNNCQKCIKRTHVQRAQFFELIFRSDLHKRCMCENIFPVECVCVPNIPSNFHKAQSYSKSCIYLFKNVIYASATHFILDFCGK